jgi:glycogenin glucosyltransferase
MKYSFVSYLGTDHFLPGVLALSHSLSLYNKKYSLLILVSKTVSDRVVTELNKVKIRFKKVVEIENPQELGDDERNFKYMYTKLRIFELTEYDKIVYLDADMIVCGNIEILFDHSHLSAVIAGGLLPANRAWKDLNAGLLVIEPNKKTFALLHSSIGKVRSADGGDQGFLHTFYNWWPQDANLHLDHKYNVPFPYLEDYCGLAGYKFSYLRKSLNTDILVIHYWGKDKPWHIALEHLDRKSLSKFEQALILWWDMYLHGAV